MVLRLYGEDPEAGQLGKEPAAADLSQTRRTGATVPAYFVVELEATNPAGMEPYRSAVEATIAHTAVAI